MVMVVQCHTKTKSWDSAVKVHFFMTMQNCSNSSLMTNKLFHVLAQKIDFYYKADANLRRFYPGDPDMERYFAVFYV